MPKLSSTENHYRMPIHEINKKTKDGKKYFFLEVGAGPKMIENFIPKNVIYHTLDNAENFWHTNYTYSHNLDGGKFPIKNNKIYDILLCNDTLEHVMYPEKIIEEMIRVAKDDATFFFSMPNEYNFMLRIYYLIGKKTEVDEPFKVVEKNLHIHKPRVEDIINLFSKYFVIEKVDYVWQSRKSEGSEIARRIDKIFQKLAKVYPSLFCRTVSLKCRKKSI